jgi:hypothetical protein
LPERFAVCRLPAGAEIPAWAVRGEFFSITRTPDELSLVVPQARVPRGIATEPGWRCFRVEGPLPLTAIGVLASLAAPLADASVSLFAVSTHDTDYLLVREAQVEPARDALAAAGHTVRG